jgi:hypothetical protein
MRNFTLLRCERAQTGTLICAILRFSTANAQTAAAGASVVQSSSSARFHLFFFRTEQEGSNTALEQAGFRNICCHSLPCLALHPEGFSLQQFSQQLAP